MAAVITAASVQKGAFGTGTTGTISVPLSASGNNRILVISFNSKDNSGTAATVTSITFDSTGVNRTIGLGITQQGSTQTAVEGSFATMHGLYFILETNLPSSAGTYNIDIALDSAVQYNMWTCYEITGCSDQAYDALFQSSDTANTAANTNWSTSLTPTVNDCLIVDNYALSHSGSGTYSQSQTLVAAETSYLYGGSICTQFTQTTAAAKTFLEQYSQLTHRRSWSIYSFSGATSGTTINVNTKALAITTNQASIKKDTGISANTKALTITTLAATITLAVNVAANTKTLSITTQQASINAGTNVNANTKTLSITTYGATISTTTNTNISANTQALALSTYVANINAKTNITSNLATLALMTYNATISTTLDTNIATNTQALAITTYQASIKADTIISANTNTLTLTTYSANISTSAITTPDKRVFAIANENRILVVANENRIIAVANENRIMAV